MVTGLNIPTFAVKVSNDYEISKTLTAPLAAIIATQGKELPDENAGNIIKAHVNKSQITNHKAESIEEKLSVDTLRVVKQAQEKGAGSWLSVIPLEDQGFTLTKSEFRDSLALRYNRPLRGLPSKCPCGQTFDSNSHRSAV